MRTIAVLLTAGASLLVLERPAHACTQAMGAWLQTTAPRDATTGVPRNVRPWFRYFAASTADTTAARDVALRVAGGAEVPTAIEVLERPGDQDELVVVLTPDAVLAPDTDYELLSRQPATPCPASSCESETRVVVGRFRTGSSVDSAPPVFAGLTGVRRDRRETCESSVCCGPYVTDNIVFSWQPASDAQSGVAYTIERLGDAGPVPVLVRAEGLTAGVTGAMICSGSLTRSMGFVVAPGRYRVRAVDLAGNVDENDVTFEVGNCTSEPTTTDAGVGDASHDGGDGASGGDGGCAVGPGAAPPAGGGLAALALLAGAVVLRRRGRGC